MYRLGELGRGGGNRVQRGLRQAPREGKGGGRLTTRLNRL